MGKKGRRLLFLGMGIIVAGTLVFATTDIPRQGISKRKTTTKDRVEKGKIPKSQKKALEEVRLGRLSRKVGAKYTHVTVRPLVATSEYERFPSWSPDGQEIVFIKGEDGYYGYGSCYKINQDGTGLTLLGAGDPDNYTACYRVPRFSPDGSKILYRFYDGESGGIWMMNPDGSDKERVTPYDPDYCRGRTGGVWSPDGEYVYYIHDDDDDVYSIQIGTTNEVNLTEQFDYTYCMRKEILKVSPDGEWILFKNDEYEPAIIDTSGTTYIEIDPDHGDGKRYDWSPDGNRIVYGADCGMDLWIANSDGTGQAPLLEDYCYIEPEWSPDGKWILYIQYDSDYDVYVTSIDGLYQGNLSCQYADDHDHSMLEWSPQGDRIVYGLETDTDMDIYVIDLNTDDNDFDGLLNWEEEVAYGTDPENRDTDGGDENDGSEIANGRDPLDPGDDMSAPPYTDGHDPSPGETEVSPETDIVVHVKDDGAGVNESSIVMTVGGATITPTITGPLYDFTLTYVSPTPFDSGQVVLVTIDASDLFSPPNVMPQDAYFFTIEVTGVEETEILPTEFNLMQNTPNPMHDKTNIRFNVPHTTYVTLRIYDTSGRLIRTLIEESKEAGCYLASWNRRDASGNVVSSGIYLYELNAGEYKDTKKIVAQ